MHIWLINHYAVPPIYYPLVRPASFAKYLMAMGHTVTIIAASTVHNSDKNLITDGTCWREETVDGVHYVYIKCLDYQGNGLRRIYNMCEFAWKLPGVCKRFPRPDAIVATSMPPTSCAVGIHLARKYKCRGVAEIADLWPESIVAYGIAGSHHPAVIALRWLEKWIYKKADAVVFTMEGAYDYIVEQGWEQDIPKSKVHYINNGIDLELFDYNRVHFQIEDPDLKDPNIFKVVYTGSIRKVNDLGALLDVAKKITDPRIKLLIWGTGDELPMLRQRILDEGIKNVLFKGYVEKKYISFIVSCADVNLIHSGLQGKAVLRFGISANKMFDCLAAGKPVLMDFSVKYNPLTEWNAGISLENPEQLPQAIQYICAQTDKAREEMGKKARHAAEQYDFKRLTEKLLDVIAGKTP